MSFQFTPSNTVIDIFTFKEGLLAWFGHDLRLRCEAFSVVKKGTAAAGAFDATSIKVQCARHNGEDNFTTLQPWAHKEINNNVLTVLKTKQYPEIRFSTDDIEADVVVGQLELGGVTAPVKCMRVHAPDTTERVDRCELDTRDFGIPPFSGVMGGLKLKPTVVVEVRRRKN
jgi:hypothetical protein